MNKVRIVKRTHLTERVTYVIQRKHWLLFWLWMDAWDSPFLQYEFSSLDKAKENLRFFDGSGDVDEVVLEHVRRKK